MKRYRGHRDAPGVALIEVLEDGAEVGRPLRHHIRHSPTGFEWGYAGSGPADTARCLLIDYLGHDVPATVYQRFKAIVVQGLPAQWELRAEDLARALAQLRAETGLECLRCGDRGYWLEEDGYCTCDEGRRARLEIEGIP